MKTKKLTLSCLNKINYQINFFLLIILALSNLNSVVLTDLKNSNSGKQITDNSINLEEKFQTINRRNKASYVVQSLNVDKNITADALFSDDIEVIKSIKIADFSSSNSTIASSILSEKVITDTIRSFDGELEILGNIILVNEIEAESLNLDSLATDGLSFSISGVKQWLITHHENFDNKSSLEKWSDQRISSCNSKDKNQNEIEKKVHERNIFLGGHCNFSHHEVAKTFKSLPKHTKVRITAKYYFIDDWNGEYGYMKINGKVVWTKKFTHNKKSISSSISICGNSDYLDNLSEIIDITLSHNEDQILLTFGSTIKKDPCIQSFGVDDIIVYVK
jgi:hypothetical protein